MGFLSDKRAKKRIRPLRRGNALAKVRALTPVSFAYKNKYGGGPDQAGLLAEDVAKAIPEAVTTGPDGMKRVNPMALNALVVQAIKELDNV
jgi:hypothetical protein